MRRPLDYAGDEIRKHRQHRIAFGNTPKEFNVALQLDGEGYFTPFDGKRSQVSVVHNKKFNVNQKSFATEFNGALDGYGIFERASTDHIVETVDGLSHAHGRSKSVPLKVGPFTIDPLLDGNDGHRLGKPIHIFKHQKLATLIQGGHK